MFCNGQVIDQTKNKQELKTAEVKAWQSMTRQEA